ncbi:cupin domain-containing protein [Ovoidimarina sediminis]|uniref:cupin domain-containing protein n=1 Tax=Ovoidimarina sediminis TaxID=3079856 RepID=UPI00290D173C|nr:cupin domain-containing protein [Rhodophyticola sp. MJ-SS7]MDU8942846.1 cupin domain-containing protein [Rhodophyticola sp. MJ-SS7]
MEIGTRLRSVREARGLSQRELAARAGLTNGTISLIEQNKSSPSVASLKSLLDAIPMSLSEFFAEVEEADAAPKYFYAAGEFTELGPSDHGLDDLLSLRQLGNAARHSLQMLHETYPPGADTGPDMLSHEAEEAGIVISGIIEITVRDQRRVLNAGDGYLFDSRLPHRFRNIGDAPCVIVSACTPPTF